MNCCSDDFFYFCHRFDHSGKGELTEKELYNVLKMQNQVDCTREEESEIEIANLHIFRSDWTGRQKGV